MGDNQNSTARDDIILNENNIGTLGIENVVEETKCGFNLFDILGKLFGFKQQSEKKVEEIKEQVKEQIKEQVKEELQELFEEVKEKVEEVKEEVEEVKEQASEEVKEQPSEEVKEESEAKEQQDDALLIEVKKQIEAEMLKVLFAVKNKQK